MKEYLFSYQNTYGEKLFITSAGKNRQVAKNRIPFPCTYIRVWKGGPSWLIDSKF